MEGELIGMQGLTPNEQTILKIMRWTEQGFEDGCIKYAATPSKDFWGLWRRKKDTLKNNGVSVGKVNDLYIAYKYEIQSHISQKFNKKPVKALLYPDLLKGKQKSHVIVLCNALINYGAAIDASETGTGKTYCARSVAKELGVDLFVICPKISISMWRRVTQEIGVSAIVINYEKLRTYKTEYLQKIDNKKSNGSYKFDGSDELKWSISKSMLIVFDEAHRSANYKSITSDILVSAVKQGYDTLLLSATLVDSPLKMMVVGFALRLFSTLRQFWGWAFKYGVSKETDEDGNTYFEFDDSNPVHLKNINKLLFPARGGRLTQKDMPELFKGTFIIAESYDVDGTNKIQKYYDELRYSSRGDRTRLRREIELCKVSTFVQMAKDAIEEGNSVLIFVNFKDTLKAISEFLDTDCVVHGDQNSTKKGLKERELNIQKFQSDESRIIILNVQAGGESVSLHDVRGQYPRVSLISPTDDSMKLKQVFGRPHRLGEKSQSVQKLIFAANTVEEQMAYNVRRKLKNLSLLNDGDLVVPYEIEGGQ